MRIVNQAGWVFVWPEGSPIIEVFRNSDPMHAPFEAVWAGDEEYSRASLNRIANESKEYAHA